MGGGGRPLGLQTISRHFRCLKDAINDHVDVEHLHVQADSKYAIDTYEKWMDGHRRRGWKTAAKAPVKNQEILEQLIAARDERRAVGLPDVELEHVRGHSGHRLNEWADERAVRASRHAAEGKESAWSSLGAQEPIDVSVDPPKNR